MEPTWEEARVRNDKALKELKRVEKEIEKLWRELEAGSLDKIKLEAGLEKLQKEVCAIADHIPTFRK
jgi:predicted  nucleic acid-binding Zn-ribbon protein